MSDPAPAWEGRVLPANTEEAWPAHVEEAEEARRHVERRLWWTWVAGTVLAWAVPLALVAFAARFIPALHPLDDGWQYLLVLLAGIVQARALRAHLPGAAGWAAVTAAGAAAAVLVYMVVFAGPAPVWRGAPTLASDGISATADLLLGAVPQWLWLRGRVRHAAWWLVVCAAPAALVGVLAALGQLAGGSEAAPVDESIAAVALSAAIVAYLIAVPQASALIRLTRHTRPPEPTLQ